MHKNKKVSLESSRPPTIKQLFCNSMESKDICTCLKFLVLSPALFWSAQHSIRFCQAAVRLACWSNWHENMLFLDVTSHLCKWVCPSVRPLRLLKNRRGAHLMASIGSCSLGFWVRRSNNVCPPVHTFICSSFCSSVHSPTTFLEVFRRARK